MNKKTLSILLAFLIVPGIGLLDQVSGDDLSLIPLYLIPIALASWNGTAIWGSALALLAIASWTLANVAFPSHVDLDTSLQRSWELAEKAIFFALAVTAIARLRFLVDSAKKKSLSDYATGLPNRRAFVADLAAAQAVGGALDVGFIELNGLENLYLDRGEAFVESLLKAAADMARGTAPTYRFGDERLAFIFRGGPVSDAGDAMRKLAARIEADAFAPKGLSLSLKIGIAHCPDCSAIAPAALRKFLEGSMIYLRGKDGTRVESFEFVKNAP
jgi:GGDEF domain-containing protein